MDDTKKIKIIPENLEDAKCAEQMEALVNHWWETEEGKKELMSTLNRMFYFYSDGTTERREEK